MDPVFDFPALESHMLCAEASQADFAQQMMKMGFMVTWLLVDFLGAVYGDHQRLMKERFNGFPSACRGMGRMEYPYLI